jgi:hypothetical protein
MYIVAGTCLVQQLKLPFVPVGQMFTVGDFQLEAVEAHPFENWNFPHDLLRRKMLPEFGKEIRWRDPNDHIL